MKKKWFLPLGILAVLILAALIYTRPMPLEALCEADITQCQSVFGTHFREPQAEDTRFAFPADDARCAQLTALFAQQKFRRSLANLLPQGGTTHRTQDGDFRWEVGFRFGATDFRDGKNFHRLPLGGRLLLRRDRLSRRQHGQRRVRPVQELLRQAVAFPRLRR